MNWKNREVASTGFYANTVNQKFTFDATNKLSFYARGGYYDNKTRRPYEAYDYNILHETFNYGIGAQYMIIKGIILPQTVTPIIFLPLIVFLKTIKPIMEKQVKSKCANGPVIAILA